MSIEPIDSHYSFQQSLLLAPLRQTDHMVREPNRPQGITVDQPEETQRDLDALRRPLPPEQPNTPSPAEPPTDLPPSPGSRLLRLDPSPPSGNPSQLRPTHEAPAPLLFTAKSTAENRTLFIQTDFPLVPESTGTPTPRTGPLHYAVDDLSPAANDPYALDPPPREQTVEPFSPAEFAEFRVFEERALPDATARTEDNDFSERPTRNEEIAAQSDPERLLMPDTIVPHSTTFAAPSPPPPSTGDLLQPTTDLDTLTLGLRSEPNPEPPPAKPFSEYYRLLNELPVNEPPPDPLPYGAPEQKPGETFYAADPLLTESARRIDTKPGIPSEETQRKLNIDAADKARTALQERITETFNEALGARDFLFTTQPGVGLSLFYFV